MRRYKEMERLMTVSLSANFMLFILYLIFAGMGIIWLKVILTILVLGISGLCLAFLYQSQELLKPRSLWMTLAAGCTAFCHLVSLILNFPAP